MTAPADPGPGSGIMSGSHFDYITDMLHSALAQAPLVRIRGRVIQVIGTIVKAVVPSVKIGEVCILRNPGDRRRHAGRSGRLRARRGAAHADRRHAGRFPPRPRSSRPAGHTWSPSARACWAACSTAWAIRSTTRHGPLNRHAATTRSTPMRRTRSRGASFPPPVCLGVRVHRRPADLRRGPAHGHLRGRRRRQVHPAGHAGQRRAMSTSPWSR